LIACVTVTLLVQDQFKYTVLRVRRNRVETALSLIFRAGEFIPLLDRCALSGMISQRYEMLMCAGKKEASPEMLQSRWHPMERKEDVIYRMSLTKWANFTSNELNTSVASLIVPGK
jgi:hypothetical protein